MTALLVGSQWVYRAGHRNHTLRQQWVHSLAGAGKQPFLTSSELRAILNSVIIGSRAPM